MQLFWVYQWFAWSCLWETIATSCENSIILMTSKGAGSSSANSTDFDGNRVLVVVIGISFFEKRRWGEGRWNPWKVLHWKDTNCWTWLGLGSKQGSIRGFSRSKCLTSGLFLVTVIKSLSKSRIHNAFPDLGDSCYFNNPLAARPCVEPKSWNCDELFVRKLWGFPSFQIGFAVPKPLDLKSSDLHNKGSGIIKKGKILVP